MLLSVDQTPGTTTHTAILPRIIGTTGEIPAFDDAWKSHQGERW